MKDKNIKKTELEEPQRLNAMLLSLQQVLSLLTSISWRPSVAWRVPPSSSIYTLTHST